MPWALKLRVPRAARPLSHGVVKNKREKKACRSPPADARIGRRAVLAGRRRAEGRANVNVTAAAAEWCLDVYVQVPFLFPSARPNVVQGARDGSGGGSNVLS